MWARLGSLVTISFSRKCDITIGPIETVSFSFSRLLALAKAKKWMAKQVELSLDFQISIYCPKRNDTILVDIVYCWYFVIVR